RHGGGEVWDAGCGIPRLPRRRDLHGQHPDRAGAELHRPGGGKRRDQGQRGRRHIHHRLHRGQREQDHGSADYERRDRRDPGQAQGGRLHSIRLRQLQGVHGGTEQRKAERRDLPDHLSAAHGGA
ncbi:Glycosyltransferase, partial [Dysosmobacter welbionis]